VKPEIAAKLWPDLVKRPRDERLAECGFDASLLRQALTTTRRTLKSESDDARLRAADQVYRLAGVYAPSENGSRSGPGIVIVNLPDLRELYRGPVTSVPGHVLQVSANVSLPATPSEDVPQ
jgi:uncharacterized protein (DUF885 family)